MTEWTKKQYNSYYNSYVPWLEDKYLAWFGENKTSYTAKGVLLFSSSSLTHRFFFSRSSELNLFPHFLR